MAAKTPRRQGPEARMGDLRSAFECHAYPLTLAQDRKAFTPDRQSRNLEDRRQKGIHHRAHRGHGGRHRELPVFSAYSADSPSGRIRRESRQFSVSPSVASVASVACFLSFVLAVPAPPVGGKGCRVLNLTIPQHLRALTAFYFPSLASWRLGGSIPFRCLSV